MNRKPAATRSAAAGTKSAEGSRSIPLSPIKRKVSAAAQIALAASQLRTSPFTRKSTSGFQMVFKSLRGRCENGDCCGCVSSVAGSVTSTA